MNNRKLSRRAFLSSCTSTIAVAAIANIPAGIPFSTVVPVVERVNNVPEICAFSRMFDFLGDEMFPFIAEVGFAGIDLTVRPQGFVSPENVEKELPQAFEKAQKAGLSIPMVATHIQKAADPLTERILKTASGLGIRHYRMNYYNYDQKLSIEQNLNRFKKDLQDLCELNARYGIQGNYQNHVGGMFGSPVWDLYEVIKDMDPRYMACQYDVRHAVAEGFSSWKLALKAICSHIGTLCLKDFVYENQGEKWGVKSVPLNTGVVDFNAFTRILKENQVSVPISYHPEFPLYNETNKSLTNPEKMKQMLPVLKEELARIWEIME